MIGDRHRNNLVSGRYRLGACRIQQIGPQIQFSPYLFSTSVQGSQLGPRYATFGPSIGFSIKDLNCLPFLPSLFACQRGRSRNPELAPQLKSSFSLRRPALHSMPVHSLYAFRRCVVFGVWKMRLYVESRGDTGSGTCATERGARG
jgi:hypothetical protein